MLLTEKYPNSDLYQVRFRDHQIHFIADDSGKMRVCLNDIMRIHQKKPSQFLRSPLAQGLLEHGQGQEHYQPPSRIKFYGYRCTWTDWRIVAAAALWCQDYELYFWLVERSNDLPRRIADCMRAYVIATPLRFTDFTRHKKGFPLVK